MPKPLNLTKPVQFRQASHTFKNMRYIGTDTEKRRLVFAYDGTGNEVHYFSRDLKGRHNIDSRYDVINVVEKRQAFRMVSPITGNFGSEYPTLEQAMLNWGAVPHLGYVITDFEDNKPVNITFVKNEENK